MTALKFQRDQPIRLAPVRCGGIRSAQPIEIDCGPGVGVGEESPGERCEHRGARHELTPVAPGDHREALAAATVDAHWLARCPVLVLLSADTTAADDHFRELGPAQGERFAWFEAGLIAQNLYLWAAAAGLGTVFIGGLDAPAVAQAAHPLLPAGESVLGLLPLGRPS